MAYIGMKRMLVAGRGRMTGQLTTDYIVLFPSGDLFWRLPEEGLEGLDIEQSKRESPEFWGHYELTPDSVVITWPGGSQRSTGPHTADDHFTVDGTEYQPVAPGDGIRLAGTYWRDLRDSNRAPEETSITFAADGRFDDHGILSVIGLSDATLPNGAIDREAISAGSGTYSVGNYTLTLNYADGRVRRVSFHLAPGSSGGDQPRSITLHTYLLELLPDD